MSGIALFLKLALGQVPARFLATLKAEVARLDIEAYAPGLYIGSSGIAWTLLALGLNQEAEQLMEQTQRSPLLYENADLFYGSAGWGLTNLYFYHHLNDEKYLERATATFHQLRSQLTETPTGLCYQNTSDTYYGLAHGAAGIAYFMLKLYEASRQDLHREYAQRLLAFDLASAEPRPEYVLFSRSVHDRTYYPYWRTGSAGIGSIALRFYQSLRDESYLQIARKTAHYLAGKYTVFPSNFLGMAGIGNFFVDLYRYDAEVRYLAEARRFADRILLFTVEKPAGIVFPGEELLRLSTDFGTGSAGTGLFLWRILNAGGVPYLDF